MLKKYFLKFIFFSLISILPLSGYCTIWDSVRAVVAKSPYRLSYEDAVRALPILVDPRNVKVEGDRIVVADGLIEITSTELRSFSSPESPDRVPEFTYRFAEREAVGEKPLYPSVLVDIIPEHKFFDGVVIGGMSYLAFVQALQDRVLGLLGAHGFPVSVLRREPGDLVGAARIDEINRNPPQIVLSMQFNNDKQLCMTTFCKGNILLSEFGSERQRARFVASLLMDPVASVRLGGCIAGTCHAVLGVEHLASGRASFEGNARPVPAAVLGVESEEDLQGIATRNLLHCGIFAPGVVIPFPDMQWVREQADTLGVLPFIDKYAGVLVRSITDYWTR